MCGTLIVDLLTGHPAKTGQAKVAEYLFFDGGTISKWLL